MSSFLGEQYTLVNWGCQMLQCMFLIFKAYGRVLFPKWARLSFLNILIKPICLEAECKCPLF